MAWERGVWGLYLKVLTQWRYRTEGFSSRRVGLEYAPAIALAQEKGWSVWRLLSLLQVIELTVIEEEAARAE